MPIRAFLYDSQAEDHVVALTATAVAALASNQLLWIDLDAYADAELDEAAGILALPGEAVRNLKQKLRRPRLDIYGAFFHVNVTAICSDETEFRTCELDFIVGSNYVLSAHREAVAFLRNFADQVKRDSQLGDLQPAAMVSALLDWLITDYFRAIERFEAEVDTLEALALRFRSEKDMLAKLVASRRRISQIRRALSPNREVFAALARPDFQALPASTGVTTFRTLHDRLERALETVDNARDLVVGAFEILATQTTQRTNHTIKLLTLVSVALLPASLIASLMGMSFRTRIYETGDRGFWTVIGSVAVLAISTLALARRFRWL
ncbi:MAG TPA: CorA family divalent cation transporter [Chthonomonadaceae bacterium]|nr:CorA family divalent cation transporter [Chthonomonadaceae bacterium]